MAARISAVAWVDQRGKEAVTHSERLTGLVVR
jgi:hypothetical protein